MREKNKTEGSTIYLVATPIGNLADISERAIKVLTEADFIAAEDTRNSLKLLNCLGIKKELVSYHEHNKKVSGERIIARVLSGESCAVITDAGIRVSVIPGACAAVSALSISALCTRRFAFEGFLSANKGERERHLESIKNETRTMIFYEAPHKLKATLSSLLLTFGETRRISLCRELTKLNEEVIRTTLGEAVKYYEENEPRGEYALIVEGADEAGVSVTPSENPLLSLSPEEHIAHYEAEGLSRMDATKKAAKDRGMTKSELYKLVNS